MMTDNIRDFVPQLRPHNNRRDNHVHFMISRRPMLELSPEDVSFYDSIDGHKTVGELEQTYPQACQRLLQWHDAFALELIPPIDHVMSPHIVKDTLCWRFPTSHVSKNFVRRLLGRQGLIVNPEHLREYTLTTVKAALNAAEFEVLRSRGIWFELPRPYLVERFISPYSPIRAVLGYLFPRLASYLLLTRRLR